MHCTSTSAYYPQGNGQVERFICTDESMLAKVALENQKDWDTHVPSVLMAYWSAIHASTGFTPFHLTFGRSPRLPVDFMLGRALSGTSCPEFVQDLHQTLRRSFTLAHCRLCTAHFQAKTQYDQHGNHTPFHIVDHIWFFVPTVNPWRTKKLASLWRDPYTVLDKVFPVTYCIQLSSSNHQLVVHQNQLKLCLGDAHHQRGTHTSSDTTTAGQV